MPSNAKVYLHYGPYEAAGTVEYRQSRLQGLKSKSTAFSPYLIGSESRDLLMLIYPTYKVATKRRKKEEEERNRDRKFIAFHL